jgi:hypothetical protein
LNNKDKSTPRSRGVFLKPPLGAAFSLRPHGTPALNWPVFTPAFPSMPGAQAAENCGMADHFGLNP